jgi:prepilin-type N-terminal cleavage/methylation domain-containing protein
MASRGFTIVELMIATTLSAIVFAAIFGAYVFIARNLSRLANTQQQMMQSRDVLLRLARDVNEATAITSATDATLVLTLNAGTVTYTYNSGTSRLTRTLGGGSAVVLVTNLTSFSFVYFSRTGSTALTPSPGTISNPNVTVGRVEMRYTSAVGSAANGTRSNLTIVSSRLVMRSKATLGQ